MSYSSNTKERLAKIVNECEYCNLAELSALVRFSGRIKNDSLLMSTENKEAAECMKKLISYSAAVRAEIVYREKSRLYEITISDPAAVDNICDLLMITDGNDEEIAPFECCRGAYIRGAFLGGGSLSDPKKSYHLEFDSRFLSEADRLLSILKKCGISAKKTCRKGHNVVYIKDYNTIADCLGLMGDSVGALDIYYVSAEKDVRNSINRRMNFENANMDKTADAYQKHFAAIKKIEKTIGLDKLTPVLKEIAEIRLLNPEDSLRSLGEKLEKPIGKSGVNHRLNRIVEIADEIK